MGSSPEPAVPAYRSLSMSRKRPQVLVIDLKCSEMHLGGFWRWLRSAHRVSNSKSLNEASYRGNGCLIAPEVLEPVRRQLGVTNRVLNVAMAEPCLQRPRVVAGIG